MEISGKIKSSFDKDECYGKYYYMRKQQNTGIKVIYELTITSISGKWRKERGIKIFGGWKSPKWKEKKKKK